MKQKKTWQKILPPFNNKHFPSGVAVFLDIDGTLLEIADNPGKVKVPAYLKRLLAKLEICLNGAIAFISGRTICEIDQLFTPLKLPVSGKHGFERRDVSGQTHKLGADITKRADSLLPKLEKFTFETPGIILENKEETIALHYRLNPGVKEQAKSLIDQLISNYTDLEVVTGKEVFEIRGKDSHKGIAIANFMSEQPFVGKTPFFFGDDKSDEDGFNTVNSITGVSICINPQVDSLATFRLETISSVTEWLESFCRTLEGTNDEK